MATQNASASLSGSGGWRFGMPLQPQIYRPRTPPWRTPDATYVDRFLAAPPAGGPGSFRAVTTSDTVPLDPGCRGLLVTANGTITVKGLYDLIAVSLGTQAAGTTIPGRFSYVMATGTTATVIAEFD